MLAKTGAGITTRQPPHRSEAEGLPEHAVRRVKEGISALLAQSVFQKSGGEKQRHASVIFETYKTHWQERRFGTPFDGPVRYYVRLLFTGWSAGFELFAFWATGFPCVLGSGYIFYSFPGIVAWRMGAQTDMNIFLFWALLMKSAAVIKYVSKGADFCTFHIDTKPFTSTHNRVEDTKSVHSSHICLKSQVFRTFFHNENCPVRTGTLRHRKDG